jgi:hypothetical protein
VARNIYGVDPASGFALRVFDNVGVQYGLQALNAGVISAAQFLRLNRRIGGYDRDDNYMAERSAADRPALVQAYRSGLQLSGAGGLAQVPIIDLSGTVDEHAGYHYQWYHFAVRERLLAANGDFTNHVMWRGNYDADAGNPVQQQAFDYLNQWVAAVKADPARLSQHRKVARDRPAQLRDGCWTGDVPRRFIPETQVFGREPDTRCNALWPSYAFPRYVAGGPLAASILKCRLKPVDPRDYRAPVSADELRQLRVVFPQGVCDWSRPGVDYRRIEVGASYGPAPSR